MLREQADVEQIPGEKRRRWFSDDYFDLIVWETEYGEMVGFQLCYDKGKDEHALTWFRETDLRHNRVDDGESPPLQYKSTPILVPDGSYDAPALAQEFLQRSALIDPRVASVVHERLTGSPLPESP